MIKVLRSILLLTFLTATLGAFSQRYLDEVFTSSDIIVESDVIYATNIDFMTSNLAGANTMVDIGTLSALADNEMAYPAEYYDPMDASTDIKVVDIPMDIYYPDPSVDDVEARPLIVYLHTGNFLPPPLNGSTTGLKTDSAAVELCMGWAKRGYVAVSVDYRKGWNPIAPTVQERRGTLLNAVYRAIHDAKMAVRYLRADALGDNMYEIDESKIVLYGQGSGGYASQAYTTLDNAPVELFLEKFLPNPFDPETSYIDTLAVGPVSGFGYPNSVNLYRDNGVSAEVHMSINAGGALADESWLEAGDVPMVALNCVRDDFAPFHEGTVIVPTTQEDVVDVHGANFFIQKAVDLGNNDSFINIPDGDPYTDAARALYGETIEVSQGNTIDINDTPEGLFPIIRPLYPFLTNESAPWEWWDPNSAIALTEVAPGITAHMASLSSNPDMSPEKGKLYVDTIQGYILPRVMCALDLPGAICEEQGNPPANDDCVDATDINSLFGGALDESQYSEIQTNVDATVSEDPADGWDCFGEPDGGAGSPSLENTIWYTFEGDGNEYTIQTGDCDGALTDTYISDGDTQFAIYSGTDCTDLVAVACNEDSDNAVANDYFAGGNYETEDGVTYFIMIDGFDATDLGGGPSLGDFCIEIINLTVGVEEIAKRAFSIYPNPTDDVLTLSSDDQIESVEIYNILGELVEAIESPLSNTLTIDMDNYEAGLYMVTATIDGISFTQRIVKK